MRHEIERPFGPVDTVLAHRLPALLRILPEKEPGLSDVEPGLAQHLCQLMHRVFAGMGSPLIIRIVVSRGSEPVIGRPTDQKLEDVPDPRHVRGRDDDMTARFQYAIGL